MAKVWKVYEGSEPTRGGPWHNLPLNLCVKILEFTAKDYVKSLPSDEDLKMGQPAGPRFGDQNNKLAGFAEPAIVVVEISDAEASDDWQSGFYRIQLSISDAERRIQSVVE